MQKLEAHYQNGMNPLFAPVSYADRGSMLVVDALCPNVTIGM